MLPEMSMAIASARSTSFLSCAAAGKAANSRANRQARERMMGLRVGCRQTGKNHTAARKPRPVNRHPRWTATRGRRYPVHNDCRRVPLELNLSPQDEAFRTEVRRFLDDNLTEDLPQAGRKTGGVFADFAASQRWHKVLANRGWSAPTSPKEDGGTQRTAR